jgi:hypothetical protein
VAQRRKRRPENGVDAFVLRGASDRLADQFFFKTSSSPLFASRLCEALINFTRTFSPDKPCRAVHTDHIRQVTNNQYYNDDVCVCIS